MTARDTRDRPDAPSPSTGQPSFVRRHPILAAFGVLAGLSLFATYWPASAIVVGVVAGARATGLDRKAWSGARVLARAVSARVRRHPAPPPPPAPSAPAVERAAPKPAAGAPSMEPAARPPDRGKVRSRIPAGVGRSDVNGPGD